MSNDNNQYLGDHISDISPIMREFASLPFKVKEHPLQIGIQPENACHNRYGGVVPYDYNCVHVNKSEYINASYVPGPRNSKAYIATQAPVPSSFTRFWRMVWENKTSLIIMLTQLFERGKLKAHCYFPKRIGEKANFDDIEVELLKYEIEGILHKSTFVLRHKPTTLSREVVHLQHQNWPDQGVPSAKQYKDLYVLLNYLNKYSQMENSGPIVVHCSAGIGRTGALIALHLYETQVKLGQKPTVRGIVNTLRKHRIGMVQTIAQYEFIYQLIKSRWAQESTGSSNSSSQRVSLTTSCTSFFDIKQAQLQTPSSQENADDFALFNVDLPFCSKSSSNNTSASVENDLESDEDIPFLMPCAPLTTITTTTTTTTTTTSTTAAERKQKRKSNSFRTCSNFTSANNTKPIAEQDKNIAVDYTSVSPPNSCAYKKYQNGSPKASSDSLETIKIKKSQASAPISFSNHAKMRNTLGGLCIFNGNKSSGSSFLEDDEDWDAPMLSVPPIKIINTANTSATPNSLGTSNSLATS